MLIVCRIWFQVQIARKKEYSGTLNTISQFAGNLSFSRGYGGFKHLSSDFSPIFIPESGEDASPFVSMGRGQTMFNHHLLGCPRRLVEG